MQEHLLREGAALLLRLRGYRVRERDEISRRKTYAVSGGYKSRVAFGQD
jgi:hypothetical protein